MAFALLFLILQSASAAVTVTVQEALWSGSTAGVARTNDAYTLGIPLPDSAGITCSNLTASSGTVQCVTIGSWPSGRPMWIRVDGTASLSAGSTATITLSGSGAGSNVNCSGASSTYQAKCASAGAMGSDDGTTITVNTGAATFTIMKANYRLEGANIGGTDLLTANQPGLVLMGPAYPATVCNDPPSSECTTLYKSSNDSSSTAILEENGPVKTVIRADGALKDSSGNTYMRFTQRLYFYAGKTSLSMRTMIRNADLSLTSGAFGSAYKGYRSLEVRLAPSLGSGKGFTFGNDTATPTTGTYAGVEDAYLYQGYQDMFIAYASGLQAGISTPITTNGTSFAQNGFVIQHDATTLLTHASSGGAYNAGWGDVHDSTGAGVEIGIWAISQGWPASLGFQSGGSDVRIGLRPDQNLWTGTCTSGISPCLSAYWQSWPNWRYLEPAYINFHTGSQTGTQLSNAFLSWQHNLVARADITTYNTSKALIHDLPDPAAADAYYQARANDLPAHGSGSCTSSGCSLPDIMPVKPLYIAWSAPGGANQEDFREDMMRNFLQRGQTGKLWYATLWGKWNINEALPASDGFSWTDYWTETGSSGNYMDARGWVCSPYVNTNCGTTITPSNYAKWKPNPDHDTEHKYKWGMITHYLTQGDEFFRDWILDAYKDYFSAPWNYNFESDPLGCGGASAPYNGKGGYGCHSWPERSLGASINNAIRLELFLRAIGDPIVSVNCPAAVSGTPATPLACDPMQLMKRAIDDSIMKDSSIDGFGEAGRQEFGTSPTRGYYVNTASTGAQCGAPWTINLEFFFQGALVNSLTEFSRILHMLGLDTAWTNYTPLQERMYGMASWMMREGINNAGPSGAHTYPLADPSNTASFTTSNIGATYDTYLGAANTGSCATTNQSGSVQNNMMPGWYALHEYGDTTYDGLLNTWVSAAINSGSSNPLGFVDFGSYMMDEVLSYTVAPATNYPSMVTVTPSTFTDNGGGSYTMSWTPPPHVADYKLKLCRYQSVMRQCKDWLRFNWNTNAFVDDPNVYWPFFSSESLTSPSAVATSYTITGQPTGLTASNFALKAMVTAPPVYYTLTATTTGTGAGSVSGAGSYLDGTIAGLTATPAVGSTFSGWSGGGCSGTSICYVTLTGNTTVTATFTAIPQGRLVGIGLKGVVVK